MFEDVYLKVSELMAFLPDLEGRLASVDGTLTENKAIVLELEGMLTSMPESVRPAFSKRIDTEMYNVNAFRDKITFVREKYEYVLAVVRQTNLMLDSEHPVLQEITDKIPVPISFILSTISGSVILNAKFLFDNVPVQNKELRIIRDTAIEVKNETIPPEALFSAMGDNQAVKVAPSNNNVMVGAIAVTLFSGYLFFTKTQIGRDMFTTVKGYLK